MAAPLPAPALGRLASWLGVAAALVGSTLGYLEGSVWPIQRLGGGYVGLGDTYFAIEDCVLDHRDGRVSGLVVLQSSEPIGSIEEARVFLIWVDEVTVEFERTAFDGKGVLADGGHRAEWAVRRVAVPAGKRFAGAALEGSYRDLAGNSHRLGGQLADGSPTNAENARVSRVYDRLVAGGEARIAEAIEGLGASDWTDRSGAAHALAQVRARADLAVPALLARLAVERYARVKDDIVYALGQYGAEAALAVPAILALIRSPSSGHVVRINALRALGEIGPAASDAVPDLVGVLTANNGTHRLLAIQSLGRMGPAAKVARPDLERLRDVPDGNTQAAVREALARLAD
jgi:hypothetical protein